MSTRFPIHDGAAGAINLIALKAFQSIHELDFKDSIPDTFPDDRIVDVTLTDADIVEEPIMWLQLRSGEMACTFISVGSRSYGIVESKYIYVDDLCDKILKVKCFTNSIGEKFVEKSFFGWARKKIKEGLIESFLDFFVSLCENSIKTHTIWAPIQYMEIESEFDFGSAKIAPLTKNFFDRRQAEALMNIPSQSEEIIKLFDHMRKDMQGLAAVVVNVEAESGYAVDAGRSICLDAVGLLRFFSTASVSSTIFSPVTLLQYYSVPMYHVLHSTSEDGFSYTNGMVSNNFVPWRLRSTEISLLQSEDLIDVGKLLDAKKLSEFGKIVRSALLAFSRALTFPDLSDRVLFALSSVEGLFLKNSSEPIQQNIGDRMAFLIEKDPARRRDIVENLKAIYKVRSEYIHHRMSAQETKVLDIAFLNIRVALSASVAGIGKFKTKADFIEAIESVKYGG